MRQVLLQHTLALEALERRLHKEGSEASKIREEAMIFMLGEEDTIQTSEDKKENQTKCKYCGKPFTKRHNRQMYCSESCRTNAKREQKARYQAKRRKKIKQKILIVDEYKKYNLGSYGTSANGHRKDTFSQEYIAIQKEMKRIGLKR